MVEHDQADKWAGFVVYVDPDTGEVKVAGQIPHAVSREEAEENCAALVDESPAPDGAVGFPVVVPIFVGSGD